MMLYTGTSSRYIDMTAPDQIEWVPMLFGSKPRLEDPMEDAAAQRAVFMSVLETLLIFPLEKKALTGVSRLESL